MPFAIDEADRLYERHMHIGGALWQMAKTREECILDESGLDNFPNRNDSAFDTGSMTSWSNDKHYSVVSIMGGNEEGDKFVDLALLDQKIAEAESAIKKAQVSGDRPERRRAQERREDLVRLKRVEAIYVSEGRVFYSFTNLCVQSATMPAMQGFVLVLLKLLLASVHATTGQPPPSASSNNGFPLGVNQGGVRVGLSLLIIHKTRPLLQMPLLLLLLRRLAPKSWILCGIEKSLRRPFLQF